MTDLFVLIGVLFVCIIGAAFLGWTLKKVPWWAVGVILTLVSVAAVSVWWLWTYDWQIQRIQENGPLDFTEIAFLIIFTLISCVMPVLLSVFVGSRTQKVWRVGIYGFAIFSTMFLLAIITVALYIEQVGLL